MTREQWLAEARRYAEHRYCYGQMLDDFPELADKFWQEMSPYDFVDTMGEKWDLERADIGWMPNAGKLFERKL